MNEDFKIVIPEITDNTLKLFVNNKFIGNVNVEQASQIKVDVVEYINRTHDTSILDTFILLVTGILTLFLEKKSK